VPFPVVRHLSSRPGSGLAEGVVLGRHEWRTLDHPVRPVVVEPCLAGFEAPDDPMARFPGVGTRMLCGGGIATSDVATLGTAAQMEPPSIAGEALGTAVAAGRHARVDQLVSHGRALHITLSCERGRRCLSRSGPCRAIGRQPTLEQQRDAVRPVVGRAGDQRAPIRA
jgi:hypothetical protein